MKKQEWGNATWYFLHTISYKLKEEHSDKVQELFKLFYNVCINLPCQECAGHAKKQLDKAYKYKIKTKNDLVNIIWEFHNIVNKRLGKKYMTKDEFVELYSRANTYKIIKNFDDTMKKQIHGNRAMIYTMARKRAVNDVIDFVYKNKNCFNS